LSPIVGAGHGARRYATRADAGGATIDAAHRVNQPWRETACSVLHIIPYSEYSLDGIRQLIESTVNSAATDQDLRVNDRSSELYRHLAVGGSADLW
jgi:hypothetical protein